MGMDNRGVEGTCAAPKTERRNRYIKSTAGIAGGWQRRKGNERSRKEGKKRKKGGMPILELHSIWHDCGHRVSLQNFAFKYPFP